MVKRWWFEKMRGIGLHKLMNESIGNTAAGGRPSGLQKVLQFWPFLYIPFALAWVYVTRGNGWDCLCSRESTEIIALPLVAVSILSYGILASKTKNELLIAMTLLNVAFFCREWHFVGTSNGIYVALLAFAGWYLYRRKVIGPMIAGTPLKIWLMATASGYFLSQIIARRVFAERHLGGLPMEKQYHISFEETFEVSAHLMMIVSSYLAWKLFAPREKGGE